MRQISRDPFARKTLYRRTMKVSDSITCAWCGSTRQAHTLYQYGTLADGITTRTEWEKPMFCSKSCRNSCR